MFYSDKSFLNHRGCGLSMDAAYTRTFTVYNILGYGNSMLQ